MSAFRKLPNWYWALLALWACAYAGVSLLSGEPNLRTPIFLAMVFLVTNPLIGVPALLALLAPILALPRALRRAKVSVE